MPSAAWKTIERVVAELTNGVRAWNSDADVDVITVTDWGSISPTRADGAPWTGPELEGFARAGLVDAWAIEVKNHGKVTLALIESWLTRNQEKADKLGMKSGLVVKRRGGRGANSPYVFCTPLFWPRREPKESDTLVQEAA